MSNVTNNIRNLVFSYFILFFVFSLTQVYFHYLNDKIYLIIASLTSLLISFQILRFMFAPTKIRGIDRTYVVAPDLAIVREENIILRQALPEEAPCNFCQKSVYKPFQCVNCKGLFCGAHMLPFDHNCPKL